MLISSQFSFPGLSPHINLKENMAELPSLKLVKGQSVLVFFEGKLREGTAHDPSPNFTSYNIRWKNVEEMKLRAVRVLR